MVVRWLMMSVKKLVTVNALIPMRCIANTSSSNKISALIMALELKTKNRLVTRNRITTTTGLKDQTINISSKEREMSLHNCSQGMTRLSRFWRGCAPAPDTKSWWIHPRETATKNTTDRRRDIRRREIPTNQVGSTLLCKSGSIKTHDHHSKRHKTWRASCPISVGR